MEEHTIRINIEWGHCDPAGIVFYPNFYRWFDAATWSLFRAAGLRQDGLEARFGVFGMPLVGASADFHSPLRPGDALDVTSRIGEWRRSSFTVEHRAEVAGRLSAIGRETRVWAAYDSDMEAGIKAVSVPDEVKALLPAANSASS